MKSGTILSGRQDSNLRPPAPKAGAMNRATLRPDLLLKFNPDENRDVKELIFLKKSIKYTLYLQKKQWIWMIFFNELVNFRIYYPWLLT